MKMNKKIMAIGLSAMILAATSVTAFAASTYSTPAEAVAGLTGRTVESVMAERADSGKSYGTIANDAGVLDDYKSDMLEMKKDILSEKVANGTMTQERADQIIAALEEAQVNCDGSGSKGIGKKLGVGFSHGDGTGNGMGKGMGKGINHGNGNRSQSNGHRGICINDDSSIEE